MNLEPATKEHYPYIQKIFLDSFPPEEQWSFQKMRRMEKRGKAEILAITDTQSDNHITIGFVIMFCHKGRFMLSFLAVDQKCRAAGIGQQVLNLLKEHYRYQGFFGEVEIPADDAVPGDIRLRRLNFYLRNGMAQTGIYITIGKIPLELLTWQCSISAKDYLNFYYSVAGRFYTKYIFKIRLLPDSHNILK